MAGANVKKHAKTKVNMQLKILYTYVHITERLSPTYFWCEVQILGHWGRDPCIETRHNIGARHDIIQNIHVIPQEPLGDTGEQVSQCMNSLGSTPVLNNAKSVSITYAKHQESGTQFHWKQRVSWTPSHLTRAVTPQVLPSISNGLAILFKGHILSKIYSENNINILVHVCYSMLSQIWSHMLAKILLQFELYSPVTMETFQKCPKVVMSLEVSPSLVTVLHGVDFISL